MIDREKVNSLVTKLKNIPSKDIENELLHWLEQNHPEPVVVGLSNDQVAVLAVRICGSQATVAALGIDKIINTFLDTQTFIQPEPPPSNKNMYEELYHEVKKELEQFTPDWNTAPEWATSWDLQSRWHQDGTYITCKILKEEQRPKHTSVVEVGQVWQFGLDDYTIVAVNDIELVSQNKESNQFNVHRVDDFISKFKRVRDSK